MNISELVHKLEPFIVKIIEEYVKYNTSTGTGGTLFLPREQAIWLLDSGGAAIKDYSADANGFSSANADAATGDVIWIPPCTITGDYTVTAGAKVVGASRYGSIFSGQITGAASSSIENLSITRSADSADTIKGVVDPSSGTFYINGCNVVITQAGSGDARAISAETNGTTVEVWNSYLYGNSGSGSGHGTWRDTDTSALIVVFGGRIRGSTTSCNE